FRQRVGRGLLPASGRAADFPYAQRFRPTRPARLLRERPVPRNGMSEFDASIRGATGSMPARIHPSASARLDAHARRRALEQHLAAEAIELRWPASGAGPHLACRLDEAGALDETAEVLLVQVRTEDRLHRLLQLEERELGRHQLEDDGPILDL